MTNSNPHPAEAQERENPWRDYAEHLEYCRPCAIDAEQCDEGCALNQAARASHAPATAPHGWRLVSIEAVAEIDDLLRGCHKNHAGDGYHKSRIDRARAVLSSAPQPPAPAAASGEAPTESEQTKHWLTLGGFFQRFNGEDHACIPLPAWRALMTLWRAFGAKVKLAAASGEAVHPIFAFLDGSAPFEGVWFGDKHPTRKGNYWWRSVLREALAKANPAAAPDRQNCNWEARAMKAERALELVCEAHTALAKANPAAGAEPADDEGLTWEDLQLEPSPLIKGWRVEFHEQGRNGPGVYAFYKEMHREEDCHFLLPISATSERDAEDATLVPNDAYAACEKALREYSQAPTDYHRSVLKMRDAIGRMVEAVNAQREQSEKRSGEGGK